MVERFRALGFQRQQPLFCHSTCVRFDMKSVAPSYKVSQSKRRFLLSSIGVLSLNLLPSRAHGAPHSTHKHHDMGNKKVLEAAAHCSKTASICRSHCIDLLKTGDTSLSKCLAVVNDTIAICDTLFQLTSSNSPHLRALEKVCSSVCEDCKKQCEKHAEHHAVCADCVHSCKELVDLLAMPTA